MDAIAAEGTGLGFHAATGSCVRMDAGALTYAAIVGMLRGLVATLDAGEIASSLGVHRHQVARLLPDVVAPAAPGGAPTPADDPMARTRLSLGA